MKIHHFLKKLLMSSAVVTAGTMLTMPAWSEEINITEGTHSRDIYGGSIYDSTGSSGHQVTISGTAEVKCNVYGGLTFKGDATDNHLIISGNAKIGSDYPAANVAGAYRMEGTGKASGNSVTIAGTSVVNAYCIAGGISDYDSCNNSVIIDGASVTGTVYGGMCIYSTGVATGNTVTLKGNATVNGDIYGGSIKSDVTGNTLVLDNFTGTMGNVYNFDKILVRSDISDLVSDSTTPGASLTLPEGFEGDVEMDVTVSDPSALFGAASGNGNGLAGSDASGTPIEVGSKVVLASGLTFCPTITEPEMSAGKCAFLIYDFELSAEEEPQATLLAKAGRNKPQPTYALVATATGKALTPETKVLSEGRVAAMQLNNQAGDLIAGKGIGQAKHASESKKLAAFIAMSAGHDKVDSGSHVDVDGIATMLGVSGSLLAEKALTIGGFIESGWGNYSTHNSFNQGAVRGTGESSYVGGGILLDYRPAQACRRLRGVSFDASLRAGRQETDFGTFDLHNAHSPFTGYDADAHYIAGHAGVNYSVTCAERLTSTAYARYMWNRLGSSKAKVCCEQVDFGAMSSNRLQFGLRAEYKLSDNWRPYAGIAYEWECSGNAHASIQELGVSAPSMRGGSVSGELGTTWQPNMQRPLWFNGGVQGTTGKRHGYGANLGCTIGF